MAEEPDMRLLTALPNPSSKSHRALSVGNSSVITTRKLWRTRIVSSAKVQMRTSSMLPKNGCSGTPVMCSCVMCHWPSHKVPPEVNKSGPR